MYQLILRRLAQGVLTLWIVSVLIFIGTEILPGDVAQAMLGVVVLAATLHGYLLAPLRSWHKAILFLATLGLVYPDWRASVPAIVAVLVVIVLQRMKVPAPERTGPA